MIIQATNQMGSTPVAEPSPPDQVMSVQSVSNSSSSGSNAQSGLQTANQSQNQPSPNSESQAAGQISENQVADALKKVGIKAEIDVSNKGYIIVRYVDPQSQQVILQLPNPAVIALVANLSQVSNESDPTAAGAMIDQRA